MSNRIYQIYQLELVYGSMYFNAVIIVLLFKDLVFCYSVSKNNIFLVKFLVWILEILYLFLDRFIYSLLVYYQTDLDLFFLFIFSVNILQNFNLNRFFL